MADQYQDPSVNRQPGLSDILKLLADADPPQEPADDNFPPRDLELVTNFAPDAPGLQPNNGQHHQQPQNNPYYPQQDNNNNNNYNNHAYPYYPPQQQSAEASFGGFRQQLQQSVEAFWPGISPLQQLRNFFLSVLGQQPQQSADVPFGGSSGPQQQSVQVPFYGVPPQQQQQFSDAASCSSAQPPQFSGAPLYDFTQPQQFSDAAMYGFQESQQFSDPTIFGFPQPQQSAEPTLSGFQEPQQSPNAPSHAVPAADPTPGPSIDIPRGPTSYPYLIGLAILSSYARRLTIREIYKWIQQHDPNFSKADESKWKVQFYLENEGGDQRITKKTLGNYPK